MKFIPLNIKTHYELLNSIIKIEDLINYAKENNLDTIAITDSNMFSSVLFYDACKKEGIRPIIGIDLIVDNIKLYLYCKNFNGYKNLCKIVSEKNINGITLEYIKKHSNDLKCIIDFNNRDNFEQINKIFNDLYIGYSTKEEMLEASLINERVVYINETLSIYKTDLEYVKYLLMIKDGKVESDEIDYKLENKYLEKEVSSHDIKTTIEFASDLNLVIPEFIYDLPVYKKGEDSGEILRCLCKKGLIKRLNGKVSEKYINRLKYELDVIENMGYTDYFLIVYDFILYAKKNKIIVGPGRGSGAGSLVCYCLGIIEIDPLKYNLIFERFLNPERISMPDIDVDFEHTRRDEVVEYVRNKYGHENVANIITFGTLLPKQVLRDVARTLEIDVSEVDKLTKLIKDKESFNDIIKNERFINLIKTKDSYKKLLKISMKLEGLKRHTSIHAAGVVISKDVLTDKIPLYKSGENILTGFSMEYMERMGLLKMDFLGLRNLTIIDNVLKLIEKNTGKHINLTSIPFDDEKTIKLFHDVDTVGIFQFESSGMKSFLRKLKVSKFDDIIAAISLYRPGPRENIDLYIARKEGRKKITYLVPELESILKDTYGIMIYQEQIIEVLRKLAGYSYSEADNIRRAMSKKKESVILAEKDRFIKRTTERGISKEKSLQLFEDILKFSNYGFNKSHSVAYAFICFWMGYLKAHYTEYFMANILNIHIGSEVKTKEYIDEAKILKINLFKPNINKSTFEYLIVKNGIVFPLTVIKSVGKEAISTILTERNNGEFTDYFDFVRRVYSNKVNKKVIESLIDAGALDIFNINKKTMITNLENAIDYATLCKDIDYTLVLKPELNKTEEFTKQELMEREFESFGFYLSMHPVTKYKRDNMVVLKNIEEYFDRIVNVILLIENVKNINTKKKERMSFLTLSDEYKRIEGVIFPTVIKKIGDYNKGDIVKLSAKVEKRMGNYQLIINDLQKLK